MSEAELDLLQPKALLVDSEANALACVDFFEAGEENVYLVDRQGRYMGVACQRQGFHLGWDGHDCQAILTGLKPAVFELPINEHNLPQLTEAVDVALEANPGVKEIPVVSGGAIVAVARMKSHRKAIQKSLVWNRFGMVPLRLAGKKIYISSMHNPLLMNFMRFWSGRIPVEYLTADNMAVAFSGRKDTLLVYGEDIYPESANKCQVNELFSLLQCDHERNWQKQCFISKSWAELPMQEQSNVPALLSKFDEGFQSIHFTDTHGFYHGTITCAALRKNFPLSTLGVENLSVQYSGTLDEDLCSTVKKTVNTERMEIPLLKDGFIVANGVKTFGTLGMDKRVYLQKFSPHWELISDEVVKA